MLKSDRKKVPRDSASVNFSHGLMITNIIFESLDSCSLSRYREQMLQRSNISTTFPNPLQRTLQLCYHLLIFLLSKGHRTYTSQTALGTGLRKPRPHNNKNLTLVWFPQYQEQGLGTRSFQLWQGRKFLLQELSGTVPPHDRDWRHENLLLVFFKKTEEKKVNHNKVSECDSGI